jgi:hypothetical protein
MSPVRASLSCAFLLATTAALGACAQHGASTLLPSSLSPQASSLSPQAFGPLASSTPPPCTGQKNSKKYSTASTQLNTKGGSFCVPSFGGFGGSIAYPSVKPALKLKVTSSTSNYKHFPGLGSGTPIFYLQLSIPKPVKFGHNIKDVNGLTAATIKSGSPYTMFGQAQVYGSTVPIGPCYSVASSGKYGGVIGAIGGLFEYADLPFKATAFIEVYSGKQTKTKC